MSDPFAHNANGPGATARRPRPPAAAQSSRQPASTSSQPDWFSAMGDEPPSTAISAVQPKQQKQQQRSFGRSEGGGGPSYSGM